MIKKVVNKGKVINYSILLLMVIFMTGWLYLAPRIGDDVQDMEAVKGGYTQHSNEYFNYGYWNVASLV